jgi:type IV secretory pathway VirB10-like protein
MLSNKAALAAAGLVAMAGAAGTGAFIATQRAQPPAIVSDASAPALAEQGVEATEATIDSPLAAEEDATAPAEPATAPPPAPRVRPDVRERPEPARSRRATPPATTARAEAPPVTARTNAPAPAPSRPEPAAIERAEPAAADTYARESRPAPEPAPSLPPTPRFEEVTVPAEAVIGLQLESTITSDTAQVEDRVEARVTRDVRANGEVAVPAGSRVLGSVSVVDRGGKMKERARLGVRFHTIILADGTELPLQTDTVYREGESPSNASAAKVGGGAIGGAILGAILGGGKGAAIGAGVGAGAGTAAVMAGGRRPAEIRAGSPVTVKVLSPVSVTVER